jgi:hypothetical protein
VRGLLVAASATVSERRMRRLTCPVELDDAWADEDAFARLAGHYGVDPLRVLDRAMRTIDDDD